MRFIMHVSMPVEKFNEAQRDGSAAKKLGRILEDSKTRRLEDTKPEAAYFTAKDGRRGGYIIVNIANASDSPRLAEPWFLNFNATVEIMPAMIPEDLQQAGLDEIAKKWG
jgi:hypothetical protein